MRIIDVMFQRSAVNQIFASGCASPVSTDTACATSLIRACVYVLVTEDALWPANACATAKPAWRSTAVTAAWRRTCADTGVRSAHGRHGRARSNTCCSAVE
jgi:hypothetical protein